MTDSRIGRAEAGLEQKLMFVLGTSSLAERTRLGGVAGEAAALDQLLQGSARLPAKAPQALLVAADRNLSHWRCGQNLGLLGGSPCIPTKSAFER
jgi:hypothetical protein